MRATQSTARASDVAAYAGERLAARALARKEAIALAMKSATERSHIAKVLQTSSDVGSGVGRVGPGDETLSAAPSLAEKPDLATVVLPKEASGAGPAESSIGTLASASIDTVDAARSHRFSKRNIAIAVSTLSIGFVTTLLVVRSPSRAPATPAAPPPAVTEVAPPPEPPAAPSPPLPPAASNAEPAPSPPPPAPARAAPAPKRVAPRPVAKPRVEAPAPTAKKRKIDDGF
jgi:hypothetical protein